MSFDIIRSSRNITEKYTRYLKTVFDIDNPDYQRLFDKKMNEISSFSKGPYLEVVDSFKSGRTVKELIDGNVLNSDFSYIDRIYSKTLYKHQEESITKINKKRNIVVSTGTGSGKTESFLIPILNSLMNEREERGGLAPGVRALLIYPMNALANDQIGRLRELLAEYPYITFGAYTGQTEEKEERALSKYKSLNHGQNPLENELISREKMKLTPPHILITNYSMLEYLMLRPKDNSFFQGKYAYNWRFIVLDEAHSYSGSTGIEVSMLLRRLKAYLNNPDLCHILTSATLGGEDANEEVATFASRLCNAYFSSDDVIRASRMKYSLVEDNCTELSIDIYVELGQILDSGYTDDRIYKMVKDYLNIEFECNNVNEYLFEILLHDRTFWRVKKYLSTPKSVSEVCKSFGWQEFQVSAFVNVASMAIKERKKLFDARYHMFIRATDGVFVTLGKHKDLSLTRQTTKFENGEEYKFFEVVTCTQCHAMYLIGEIESKNGRKYLKQRANLLGDNIREAFLVGDVICDDDEDSKLEDEHLQVTNYELCPHCGFVREKNMVHKTKCLHRESDYINITKVKQSELTGRVTKCIKCEGTNNLGVLRGFFAGQEASTSVIGTALFEELPTVEYEKDDALESDEGFDFDSGFDLIQKSHQSAKARQFIAFSDNRQAAAFFATYFYETYQSFLYSRVIYNGILKMESEGKPLSSFVKDIAVDFKNNNIAEMFDQNPDYTREAWKAIMKELIESYSRNSLIGLGLLKLGFVDDIKMSSNSKYNLSSVEVKDMCMVLLRSLLEDNAIFSPYTFSEADIAFYSNNGSEKVYQLSSAQQFVRSFVPKNDNTTNKRCDYIERVFIAKGLSVKREDILRFMQAIWKRLLEDQQIIVDRYDHSGMQVNLAKIKIEKSDRWYRCSKCHRITAYNIVGVCPAYKCDGELERFDINELEKGNHYYRIYNDLSIQPLRVVEHTAQLNSEEAYKLQEMFKKQEIDVLSCSTTFEMGVDIGDLETIFKRNMPPTPSNYIQRAGRAGRSLKSAALALTFCNKSNHDFSYFLNPISMINGKIKPPLFKVENEKIGIRHLYSSALAFFWKSRPDRFGNARDFFGDEEESTGYKEFEQYIESQPEDLKNYLLDTFPEELLIKFSVSDYGWKKWLFDDPNISYPNLKTVYEQYRNEVDSLYKEKARLEKDNRSNYSVITRINTYTKDNIISFLSRNNILPKYGFPVDTVELSVPSDKNQVLPIELSRDLAMAISEYAPGCEIVAAGNLLKSRYIKRMPSKSWRQYDYVLCNKCKTLNITIHHDVKDEQSLISCEQCGEKFKRNEIKTFLIPEFGFSTESKIGKPSLIKPERTFRTEASMVSEGKTTLSGKYVFGGLTVNVTTMEDGEIAVLNKSEFYVCSSCGFSLAEHEAKNYTPIYTEEHINSAGYKCKNKYLQRYSLGYRFKTDALHISIAANYYFDEAYSILQAIILSACNILNIDNNEIAGCLQYCIVNGEATYSFIVYDTTPGGAGHVKRFATKNTLEKVLIGAFYKSKNCDCGGVEGDSSCYKCLRTYQNQQHHDILKRMFVVNALIPLFDDGGISGGDEDVIPIVKNNMSSKHLRLKLDMGDSSVSTESYDYIISSLDVDDELSDRIVDSMRRNLSAKPDLSWVDFDDGEDGIYADLVWEQRKVLAFSPNNRNSYQYAINSDYRCFVFDANLDIDAFVNAIS